MFEYYNGENKKNCKKDYDDTPVDYEKFIIKKNIVCGNALTLLQVDENGKDIKEPIVFSEWTFPFNDARMQRKDYTFDELLNMDFGDEYYKGEKIVRLTEFLKNFSERNVNVYIELKETGYEKLIVDTLKQYSLKNVVLISFKYNLLKKIREMDNSIKLGWLIYDVNDSIIKDCKNIKLNYVLCTAICLSKDEVTKLKNNNFIVSAWGVLGKSEIKRLKNIDVDRIIYDSGYDVKKFLKKERKNV